jgi:hypothetical protein
MFPNHSRSQLYVPQPLKNSTYDPQPLKKSTVCSLTTQEVIGVFPNHSRSQRMFPNHSRNLPFVPQPFKKSTVCSLTTREINCVFPGRCAWVEFREMRRNCRQSAVAARNCPPPKQATLENILSTLGNILSTLGNILSTPGNIYHAGFCCLFQTISNCCQNRSLLERSPAIILRNCVSACTKRYSFELLFPLRSRSKEYPSPYATSGR